MATTEQDSEERNLGGGFSDSIFAGAPQLGADGNLGAEASTVMAEKSPRRLMLEQSLAEDPSDPFLRYGLAMQCLREGDREEGRQRLQSLIADHPEDQIVAYQQLGQSYAETGDRAEALSVLQTGIAKAKVRGDWHAAAEMEQVVQSLA